MNLRQVSALMTLNGRLDWRVKKCRFSVTNASAPVHSTYAAIRASAGLNPFASYLKTISKGTTMSSSTVVIVLMKLLNSWKASTDRFRVTSSTKRSFLLPNSFSCFTQSFYNVLFAHFKNRRRVISDYLSEFLQMFKCLLNLFHYQSPQYKVYYRINFLSNR